MKSISATSVKQNFGAALAAAAREPVAIERHGKTVAVIMSASDAPNPGHERAQARQRQALVEAQRLIKHQAVAIRLLRAEPDEAQALIADALAVVQRWEDEHLCSRHFIDGWRRLLNLPPAELASEMCADVGGWGTALRQNSPWRAAA